MKPSEVSIQEHHRDRLAAGVISRLDRDRENAKESDDVCKFLTYLRRHLFDIEFSVGEAYKECKLRPSSFVRVFQSYVGESPKQYLQVLRLEVGTRLLEETSYNLDIIAYVIGMSSGSSFSNAFQNATGERPTDYRDRWKNPNDEGKLFGLDLGKRIREGNLTCREAEIISGHLKSHFSELEAGPKQLQFFPGENVPASTVSRPMLDQLNAECLWHDIQGLREPEQQEKIRRAYHIKSPALFEFLHRKAIEEGRRNRQRGVHIAHLALTAALAAEDLDKTLKSSLWARAWGWLGNAKRLNVDLAGAAHCIALGEAFLPNDASPSVKGEILLLKTGLCWYDNRIKEGLRTANHVVDLLENNGLREALANALIYRGILHRAAGNYADAIKDYSNVAHMHAGQPVGEQLLLASYNMAVCYWLSGDITQAKELISELKVKSESIDSRYLKLGLERFDGRLALSEGRYPEAESILSRVRSSYNLMGSQVSALVGLDLAIVHLHLGKLADALKGARQARGVIVVWRDKPLFERAYIKFSEAIDRKRLSIEILEEIRNLCDQLEVDPARRSQLEAEGHFQ